MEQLFAFLNTIAPLSPELVDHLRSILVCKTFSKGDIILRKGQVCRDISFLESGKIRIFTRLNTRELTKWIQKQIEIFISVKSFFDQVPSLESIQALSDSVAWCITHEQLEETRRLFQEFNKHYEEILRFYYDFSEQRERIFGELDPRQRYEYQMETDSDLLAGLRPAVVASYLRMSTKTLKKIKRAIAKGK
jgi:CRP/FNR family transcriptional regulator, anaerobic regulatory protein